MSRRLMEATLSTSKKERDPASHLVLKRKPTEKKAQSTIKLPAPRAVLEAPAKGISLGGLSSISKTYFYNPSDFIVIFNWLLEVVGVIATDPSFTADTNKQANKVRNYLLYMIPFSSDELKELSANPVFQTTFKLSNDVPSSPRKDMPKKQRSTIVTLFSMLEIWTAKIHEQWDTHANVWRKFPPECFQRRTDLLKLIYKVPIHQRPEYLILDLREGQPALAIDTLALLREEARHNELFAEILVKVEEYNKCMGAINIPSIIKPVFSNKEIEEIKPQTLEALRQAIKKSRDINSKMKKVAQRTEDRIEREELDAKMSYAANKNVGKFTGMADVYDDVMVYGEELRTEIATLIAKDTDKIPEDITSAEISLWLIKRENLPYWAFLVDVASKKTYTLAELHRMIIEYALSPNFATLFFQLSNEQKNKFIESIFETYPLADYPFGPNVPIINILGKFTYDNVSLTPDDEVTKLIKSSPAEFRDTVISYNLVKLIVYRDIIFQRLQALSSEDAQAILDRYNVLLTFSASYTLFIDQDDKRIKIKNIVESSVKEGKVYIKEEILEPASVDFGVLLDEDEFKDELRKALVTILQALIPKAFYKEHPTKDIVDDFITDNLEIIHLNISAYFHATVPYDDKVIKAVIHDIMPQLLSSKLNIELPPEEVAHLQHAHDEQHYLTHANMAASELKRRANRLGLKLSSGLPTALSLYMKNLDKEMKAGNITGEEYEGKRAEAQELVEKYDQIMSGISESRHTLNARFIDANEIYERTIKELQDSDELLSTEEIEHQALLVVTKDMNFSHKDLEEFQRFKARRLSGNKEMQIARTLNELPLHIKKELNDLLVRMEAASSEFLSKHRQEQLKPYQDFLGALFIAIQSKDSDNIRNVIDAYSGKLPANYVRKVLDQLTGLNVTGMKMIEFTTKFLKQSTTILQNPLIRNERARQRRKNKQKAKVRGAGIFPYLRRRLPSLLPESMQECFIIHQLKPWLNIPDITGWKFLIGYASGQKRDEMPQEYRPYFSATGQPVSFSYEGKTIYLYMPTNAYWLRHCRDNHSKKSRNQCDESNLLKTLDLNSPDFQFYEVIYNPRQIQVPIIYTEDTNDIKFLSKNAKYYYHLECDFFRRRQEDLSGEIDDWKSRSMENTEVRNVIRNVGRDELLVLLVQLNLELELGRNSVELKTDSEKLENALFDYFKASGKISVNDYLQVLYTFGLPLDRTDEIYKRGIFFASMLGKSAHAYYPWLVKYFFSIEKQLPEIFLLPESEDIGSFKQIIKQYTDNMIMLSIRKKLVELIDLAKKRRMLITRLPSSGKLEEMNQIVAVQNEKDNIKLTRNEIIKELKDKTSTILTARGDKFSLKNVCRNRSEFEGVNDTSLMYYVYDDNVYCISKLELSVMAKNGIYKTKNRVLDKSFVDAFRNYANFEAGELRRYDTYIRSALSFLLDNTYVLKAKVVEFYGRQLTAAEVSELTSLVAAGDRNGVRMQLTNLSGKQITAAEADAFIASLLGVNRSALKLELVQRYSLYSDITNEDLEELGITTLILALLVSVFTTDIDVLNRLVPSDQVVQTMPDDQVLEVVQKIIAAAKSIPKMVLIKWNLESELTELDNVNAERARVILHSIRQNIDQTVLRIYGTDLQLFIKLQYGIGLLNSTKPDEINLANINLKSLTAPDNISLVNQILQESEEITFSYNYIVQLARTQIIDEINNYVRDRLLQLTNEYIANNAYQLQGIIAQTTRRYLSNIAKGIINVPEQKIISKGKVVVVPAKTVARSRSSISALQERELILADAIDVILEFVGNNDPSLPIIKFDRALIADILEHSNLYQRKVPEQAPSCTHCNAVIAGNSYVVPVDNLLGDKIKRDYLQFCSSKCFSEYDVPDIDLDAEQLETKHQQALVSQITKNNMNRIQMELYAAFPAQIQTFRNASRDDLSKYIKTFARRTHLDPEVIIEGLKTLGNEEALGILTINADGKLISDDELWDRIRAHPLFVPSENVLLANLDAVLSLAMTYGIGTYDGDNIEETEAYYRNNTDDLRTIWKGLRANNEFEKLLFSTITEYDPYTSDKVGLVAFKRADFLDFVLNAMASSRTRGQIVELTAEAALYKRILMSIRAGIQRQQGFDMREHIEDLEKFKKLRDSMLKFIIENFKQFDTKILTVSQRKTLSSFKAVINEWYNLHKNFPNISLEMIRRTYPKLENALKNIMKSCTAKGRSIASIHIWTREFIQSEKLGQLTFAQTKFFGAFLEKGNCGAKFQNMRQESGDEFMGTVELWFNNHQIYGQDALAQLEKKQPDILKMIGKMCKDVKLKELSAWTLEFLKKLPVKSASFIRVFREQFGCKAIDSLERKEAEFLYVQGKVNMIIDNVILDIAQEQALESQKGRQVVALTNVQDSVSNKGREEVISNEVDRAIDEVNNEQNVIAATGNTNMKPSLNAQTIYAALTSLVRRQREKLRIKGKVPADPVEEVQNVEDDNVELVQDLEIEADNIEEEGEELEADYGDEVEGVEEEEEKGDEFVPEELPEEL